MEDDIKEQQAQSAAEGVSSQASHVIRTERVDHAVMYYTQRRSKASTHRRGGFQQQAEKSADDPGRDQQLLPLVESDRDGSESQGVVNSTHHVLVIYTGGTIGMVPDPERGGELAPKRGYLTEQLLRLSDLRQPAFPGFDVMEYDHLIDSSDAGIEEWRTIVRDIECYYFNYDAFILCHGTDTMHYTATALSFMLRNLSKPVIVTGSMVPLREVYNDARRNFIMSMLVAGHTNCCEVCICFNDVLLRGNRAVKLTSTVAAFGSPNFPPLARVTSSGIHVSRSLLQRQPRGPLMVRTNMSNEVLCLNVTPGDCLQGALALFKRPAGSSEASFPVKVLVLRVSGGDGGEKIPAGRALKKLGAAVFAAGCVMVLAAAAVHGGYTPPAILQIRKICPDAVIVNDMSAEVAVVKAMYLLANTRNLARFKDLMRTDLRGEMTQIVSGPRL